MRIATLTAYVVHLPLKREIKHASATRRESDNLLVCCRLANGIEGWGEGVPRPYVTGETAEGAMRQLAATPVAEQLSADCGNWDDVVALVARFQPAIEGEQGQDAYIARGCYGNALRCAVELSILDAVGQLFRQPVYVLTSQFFDAMRIWAWNERVRYSGAIMAEGPRAERLSALKMQAYGFAHCKVKVGMPGADDARRLRTIRRWIGRRMDIRVDANEAWHAEEVVRRVEPLLAARISCIEQPLPHGEVDALAEVRRQLPVPVMLDESLTSFSDAKAAIAKGTCDVFNIRLSKCGGFLASLRLAAMAHDAGFGYQLGCHPGESGILSAAGRHWAASVGNIRYLEGSYDRHILRRFLTNEDITFRYGGWAPALEGPGLGVTVDRSVVEELQIRAPCSHGRCKLQIAN
jgi:L-Ala-D/L-Glu epimerase